MSKLNQDPLFRLIKSLTKSEKRYFKLYVSRHLINNFSHYITLFDAIGKQENYSEKEIYRDLSGTIKNIPSTKYHLQQKILESIALFNRGKSITSIILQEYEYAIILTEKSLHREAYNKLLKVKKTAYRKEQFELLLNILQLQRRLLLTKIFKKKESEIAFEKILEEKKKILTTLSRTNEYEVIAKKVDRITKEGMGHRSSEIKKKFDAILQNPLIKDERNATCIYSKKLLFYILQNYFTLNSDHKKSEDYALKGLALSETALDKKNKQEVLAYINAINNLLNNQIITGKYTAALDTINKLKMITAEYNIKDRDEAWFKIIQYGYIEEISVYNLQCRFEKSIAANKLLFPLFDPIRNNFPVEYKLVYFGNMAYAFFAAGRYKESLYWLNEQFSLPNELIREDIIVASKILNLINNFELNNTDLLEYVNLAASRFFKKRTNMYKVESAIVKFMQHYQKTDPDDNMIAFQKLRKEVLKAMISPEESAALENFDVISWIDSKIQNRPFAEVVKEKIKESTN